MYASQAEALSWGITAAPRKPDEEHLLMALAVPFQMAMARRAMSSVILILLQNSQELELSGRKS
jgi:hypothetical protein